MRLAVWMIIFFTCLIGVTVDSAILRGYREKAKLPPGGILDPDGKNATSEKARRKAFEPTSSRCCKIGYKMAKRKLSCDVQVLDFVRKINDMQRAKMKYNRPRKIKPSSISAKLSVKLGKCLATHSKFFEKCCKYRDHYYTRLSKCKKRPRRDRRRCRQYVRRRFKVPRNKGGRKKGRSSAGRKKGRSAQGRGR